MILRPRNLEAPSFLLEGLDTQLRASEGGDKAMPSSPSFVASALGYWYFAQTGMSHSTPCHLDTHPYSGITSISITYEAG